MVRLGQNFLADPNLLAAIVRDAELDESDVVLEVGAGEGVLSERLAEAASHLHSIELLPSVGRWTVMVQREIADRLRAAPGNRTYGSPSAIVQLACEVKLLRTVDPAVFRPRPRVESAILAMRRTGPGADEATRELIRAAFAHRRKSLARSVEHVSPGSLEAVRRALGELGLAVDSRAEALAPEDFAALSAKLRAGA